ncbi:hypothetical protein FIBSPDRAFT_1995 [Athelia psychrophila]|uniref:Uncharacterized protein n=1 Tax=Athelia psychrophila TaxID=1759441 RepID=A0A166WXW5_9AGAM|nr:hypothetical protein FIBSPDRAFT_1995 [Fibularhizoctonia sp. CBS 109695]
MPFHFAIFIRIPHTYTVLALFLASFLSHCHSVLSHHTSCYLPLPSPSLHHAGAHRTVISRSFLTAVGIIRVDGLSLRRCVRAECTVLLLALTCKDIQVQHFGSTLALP